MASAAAAPIIQHPALSTVPRRILVLTVDGNQLVQEGLAALVDREKDMAVVATASRGETQGHLRPDDITAAALTTREIQVLQLVAHGATYKQVAAQLPLAGDTVRMHMKGILEKLGAKDRTHAVAIAMIRGIFRLEMDGGRRPANA
jgi:DNA-binding NarL/FixJ family response regulator